MTLLLDFISLPSLYLTWRQGLSFSNLNILSIPNRHFYEGTLRNAPHMNTQLSPGLAMHLQEYFFSTAAGRRNQDQLHLAKITALESTTQQSLNTSRANLEHVVEGIHIVSHMQKLFGASV